MPGPIKHNMKRLWTQKKKKKKTALRAEGKKSHLSCIFMWLEGSLATDGELWVVANQFVCKKRNEKVSFYTQP